MRLLYIEWFDAAGMGDSRWMARDEAVKEVLSRAADLCRSVGFLIHEDADLYILAAGLSGLTDPEPDVDNIIGIPKGMVRVLKDLSPHLA